MTPRIASTILGVVVLSIAACTEDVADNGRLEGLVLAAPTCPVESSSSAQPGADDDCEPSPVGDALVVVVDEQGQEVASTRSAGDGSFEIEVREGTYTVVARPVEGLLAEPEPRVVAVGANQTTGLEPLVYDTGIR